MYHLDIVKSINKIYVYVRRYVFVYVWIGVCIPILNRFGGSSDVLHMMRLYGLDDLLKPLPGVYEPDTPMPIPPDIDYCPYTRHMSCYGDAIRYRTSDGSCNNLNNPIWGRSMTPFSRLVPQRYYDGKQNFYFLLLYFDF